MYSYDGDADRLSIYKKNYGIIETEKVALIFAKYLIKIKNSKNNFNKYNCLALKINLIR